MLKLKVGQIVYVLDDKSRDIYPAQIQSIIHSKTLNGNFVEYNALVDYRDGNDKQELIINDKNQNNIFDSINKLKQYLIQRATDGITILINDVIETANMGFDIAQTPKNVKKVEKNKKEKVVQVKQDVEISNPNVSKITLPNGEVVNCILPDVLV